MVLTRILQNYFRQHLKPDVYGYGFKGLLRQGLAETPAPTLCVAVQFLIAIFGTPYFVYQVWKTQCDRKRYLFRWVSYRPDDPRLNLLALPPKLERELREIRAEVN